MDWWDVLFLVCGAEALALGTAVGVMVLHLQRRHAADFAHDQYALVGLTALALACLCVALWIFGTTAGPYTR
jgi:hypothetical protein